MKKFCALTALALATLSPLAPADVVIKTRTRVVVHRPVVVVRPARPVIVHRPVVVVKPARPVVIVKPAAPRVIVRPTVVVPGYVKVHGVAFSHGHFYRGLNHRHWTKRVWMPRHGAWGVYCPSTASWYYWHAARASYYPVSYIKVAPPVAATAQTAVAPPSAEQLPEAPPAEAPRD